MFSFLNNIKNKLDSNVPLTQLNNSDSKTSMYSEIVEETLSTRAQTDDTPLTLKKKVKYESTIDIHEIKNENKTQKLSFAPFDAKDKKSKNQNTNFKRKKIYRKKSILQHVGFRLSTRKDLRTKRRLVADIMFTFGLIGIFLMIGLIEFNFSHQYELKSKSILKNKILDASQYQFNVEIFLKILISLSTVGLLVCVFIYHYIQMKIYCIDNSIEDWRIAVTPYRILSILFECLICAIHPIPINFDLYGNSDVVKTAFINNSTIVAIHTVTDSVPLDIMLSISMFARLYLLPRIVLLHSKLINDASSQSLGYLNRITFNFRFVFKAFMTQSPEYVLLILILILFIIASWGLKACEYHADSEKFGILNSMWFVAITFLTVGYGDLYPNTYCGRAISVLTGLLGVFCTALLVALVSCKLEFTRAEKYVFQFLNEIELKKQLHNSAANLIKQGWLLFRLKRKKLDCNFKKRCLNTDIIKMQRKLLVNIQNIRCIKHEQTKITDSAVNILELFRNQQDSNKIMEHLCHVSEKLENKVNKIEDKIESLEMHIQSIHDMLLNSYLKA